jgi:hypothetical protein
MLKLPVSVYRRSKSKPAFPAVTFPPECMMAAGLESGQLGYALAASGIIVVCRPEWAEACERLLSREPLPVAEVTHGTAAPVPTRRGPTAGPRARSTPVKPDR